MHTTVEPPRIGMLIRASRRLRASWHGLGPGLVTGVADDDPSGIGTYTVTGAVYGYQLLWLSIVTLPMTIAVQGICARLGIVTGRGLARTVARHYGRRWLGIIVALLFIANLVNIAADLGAIAAVIAMFVPVPAWVLVAPLGLLIAGTEIVVPYPQFARVLKGLTLVIFAYVIGAFVASPDWGAALRGTLLPEVSLDRDMLLTIVAVLGTTISPYLFFWQASQEVEEEQAQGIHANRLSGTEVRTLIRAADLDVTTGMVLANLGFYFVVLTSAATLHAHGLTDVQTPADAAKALQPLAGDLAAVLFAIGVIGTGLLAVPVLAGSVAYAAAELFDWPEGLNRTFRRAPQFYGVILLATLGGVATVFSPLSPIDALVLAAAVNGMIAPVLLVFLMVVAHDRRIMHGNRVGGPMLAVGWVTTAVMGLAAIALFASLVLG
jgi:NRAMP (natural resistance-associated macrophage protein)-like metal ion transporter